MDASLVKLVKLAALVTDPSMQARRGLNQSTITAYARVYQDGEGLPPIKVADVDGVLLVVDGWHRVAALRHINRQVVEAEVVKVSRDEAVFLAMLANLAHGLPLKARERTAALRRALGAYIAARKHLTGKGQAKSLREISADLGNHVSYTTIRKWLWEDHRKVAERLWGHDPVPTGGGSRPHPRPVFTPASACDDAIAQALATFQGVTDPTARGGLIANMEEALKQMKAGGPWEPYQEPDF